MTQKFATIDVDAFEYREKFCFEKYLPSLSSRIKQILFNLLKFISDNVNVQEYNILPFKFIKPTLSKALSTYEGSGKKYFMMSVL